jgi:hypothetical protein
VSTCDGYGFDLDAGTDRDAKALLSRLRKAGNFFIVFSSWCTTLSPAEALLLGHLINHACTPGRVDPEGWSQCTPRFLKQGLGLDKATAIELLESLADKGLLEMAWRTRRGELQPTRHVRLNLCRIEELTNGKGDL